jgi:Winged helix DNA-binding domain
MLIERQRVGPVEAIRRLTPLQGQDSPAPYVALAARLHEFAPPQLETALESGDVVKTTIMRVTLHLAAGADYPAYAQLSRQTRMRTWRKTYAHLDEERVVADLARWLGEPRSNEEIREQILRHEGVPDDNYRPLVFARTLVPLVQVPPAGYWRDRKRPRFVIDPRPLPDPIDAAALVLERYLAAFGPATKRDAAAWAGVAQRDFADAFERVPTVSYRDETGAELIDLPNQPLPPAAAKLPPRFLARWDQPLLAFENRDRIIPPQLQPLKLTHSGDQTVTVDGRVAASWALERFARWVRVAIEPHVDIPKRAHAQIREEAKRAALFAQPEAERVEVAGL